jgi:hypothetical protein
MFTSLLPYLPFLKALQRQDMPEQDQDQDDDWSDPAANQFMSAYNGSSNQAGNGSNPPGDGSNQQGPGNAGAGAGANSSEDEGPPDMSSLPQAPLPNLFPDSPPVPRFAASAGCAQKIEDYVNKALQNQRNSDSKPSGPVIYLGPTDMHGQDGDVDPDNKPGWRNGAWNVDFFAPGMKADPEWKEGRDPKSGLHVPRQNNPAHDPVTPKYGPGRYNGQDGYYFTAHFDSANPYSGNPLDTLKHFFGDYVLRLPHGC